MGHIFPNRSAMMASRDAGTSASSLSRGGSFLANRVSLERSQGVYSQSNAQEFRRCRPTIVIGPLSNPSTSGGARTIPATAHDPDAPQPPTTINGRLPLQPRHHLILLTVSTAPLRTGVLLWFIIYSIILSKLPIPFSSASRSVSLSILRTLPRVATRPRHRTTSIPPQSWPTMPLPSPVRPGPSSPPP